MYRALTILFRRDPSRDREHGRIRFEGYRIFWPDGNPIDVGLDALCLHGPRLLGLGRHLAGRVERLLELVCFPLRGREDELTRLPGGRVRRFYLERCGRVGRLHFLDGTPTETVFEEGRDDPRVLGWIGLPDVPHGGRLWLDIAARPANLELGAHGEAAAAGVCG
ncbi:MAG: hypothetical protein IT429_22025 [Gemmataceae bacterium]|nr:hypothetical protein [Gemmataceae bacterium]